MFKLTLKNYRGFLNEEFNFSRVNILIGENSAGKSSIFKFLLALKQSLRTPNNRERNITFSDSETDLGNYYETIYNHEVDRNLAFSFEFQEDYYDFFLNYINYSKSNDKDTKKIATYRENIILNGGTRSPTSVSFELSEDLSNHKNIISHASNENIGKVSIVFDHKDTAQAEQDIYLIGENPKCEIIFESKYYNKTFHIKNVQYEKQAFLTIVLGHTLREQIMKQHNVTTDKLFWQIGFLLIAQNYVQMQLAKIEYINPLLHKVAERVYLESDRKKTQQIKNIKDLIDYLDTSIVKKDLELKLTNLLSEFGIAEGFSIKKEGFTKEFRVKLNNLDNNIKDVGFGVSLQLPIFAQAIVSESTFAQSDGNEIWAGETLLIEQPEVHLHPRLQAKFIETLLSIGNNNVYFIETHSEHIIRMLQVLVKTKKFDIKPEDISIHYFRKEEKKMLKSLHKIDAETGKLKPNFPKGFYDVSYDLAFQLMD